MLGYRARSFGSEEGDVATGNPITLVKRDELAIPVAEITRLYTSKKRDVEALRRVVRLEALPEDWRDFFQERLYRATR
jgi:MOSC domain-containing protein YiiM